MRGLATASASRCILPGMFRVELGRWAAPGKEVAMPSHHSRIFDPLDLEIIDHVYKAAWAQLETRVAFRDRVHDSERRDELRKLVMNNTGTDKIEFDALYERVVAH